LNFINPLRRKFGLELSIVDLEPHFLPKLNSLKLLRDKIGETSGSQLLVEFEKNSFKELKLFCDTFKIKGGTTLKSTQFYELIGKITRSLSKGDLLILLKNFKLLYKRRVGFEYLESFNRYIFGRNVKIGDYLNFINPLRSKFGSELSIVDLEAHFLPKLNSLKLLRDKIGETNGSQLLAELEKNSFKELKLFCKTFNVRGYSALKSTEFYEIIGKIATSLSKDNLLTLLENIENFYVILFEQNINQKFYREKLKQHSVRIMDDKIRFKSTNTSDLKIGCIKGDYKNISYECYYKKVKFRGKTKVYARCHFDRNAPVVANIRWKGYLHYKYLFDENFFQVTSNKYEFNSIWSIKFISDLDVKVIKERKLINDNLHEEIQHAIDFYEFVSRSLGIQKPIRGKFE